MNHNELPDEREREREEVKERPVSKPEHDAELSFLRELRSEWEATA